MEITQRFDEGELDSDFCDVGNPAFYGSSSGWVTVRGTRGLSDAEVERFVETELRCTTATAAKRVGNHARVRFLDF